jgi:hypothetical protein
MHPLSLIFAVLCCTHALLMLDFALQTELHSMPAVRSVINSAISCAPSTLPLECSSQVVNPACINERWRCTSEVRKRPPPSLATPLSLVCEKRRRKLCARTHPTLPPESGDQACIYLSRPPPTLPPESGDQAPVKSSLHLLESALVLELDLFFSALRPQVRRKLVLVRLDHRPALRVKLALLVKLDLGCESCVETKLTHRPFELLCV